MVIGAWRAYDRMGAVFSTGQRDCGFGSCRTPNRTDAVEWHCRL